MALLEVENLQVAFHDILTLRGVSLEIAAGETLGVVGESGCGKSLTGFALMGMIPFPGKIIDGSIRLDGRELVGLSERERRKIRGKQIALVMQDPFTSLNPMMRIGKQIEESLELHQSMNSEARRKRVLELLEMVGVPVPDISARKFPHQLSGGQRQRVVLAIAFACEPKVLIADEPTTALDVTLQAQILRLLNDLKKQSGTAIMLISHDIGAVGSVSERISVFYAGKIVETGSAEQVLRQPTMPYTKLLLSALPTRGVNRLAAIPGQPPILAELTQGCSFYDRCPIHDERCKREEPSLSQLGDGHTSACWKNGISLDSEMNLLK